MSGRTVRRCAAPVLVAFAALAAAAPACAHGRRATVALDYRLTLAPPGSGIHVRVLDGDRGLRLALAGATGATVLGDLREPMLRFDGGVWVNLASPTAQADRLVTTPGHGWRRLSGAHAFSWHEHRLAPPPYVHGDYGPVAQWSVPLLVDGRPRTLHGVFVRVPRPRWWLWLGGSLAVAVAGGALVRRLGAAATIAAGCAAGAAAIVCETAFALRDSPTGRLSWIGLGVGIVVAVAAAAFIALSRGVGRAYAAGGIGAGIAAVTLSWLGIFFHGAVIAALPASAVRIACAVALAGGLTAVAGALSVREVRP